VNLAVALVLAEIALHAIAAWSGNSPMLSQALDSYRLSPGRDYGAGLRGNNLGYPGPDFQRIKPPDVYRIAALGDSFAVGPAVAFADNYLTLIEKALRGSEVYDFGVSSAGPREYLSILRQHVWQFQPDLVLVSIFVGNDITESLPTPRHLDPRQHSLYLLLTRGGRLLRERWRRGSPPPQSMPDRLNVGALSRETFRQVEARRLAVCQTPPTPDLEKKWRRAFSYLDRIIKECGNRSVPVAFVLIPDEFQVNPQVLAEARAMAPMGGSAIDLELPQRRLGAFFAERGVPWLDLLDAFKRATDTYAPRDTHWNVRGNHLAGERIVAWLRTLEDAQVNRLVSGPRPRAP
jgi:hypothetical protein